MQVTRIIATLFFLLSTVAHADDCQPSIWGIDDERGATNRMSQESVIAAAQLVQKGETHPLGIVLKPGMPAYPPRSVQLQVVQPGQHFVTDTTTIYGWDASANDDLVQMWLGVGPQLDGLGHMGEAGMFYNCNAGKDIAPITGLTKLDISKVPPMVARGVLIDMARHFGVESMSAGQPITPDDLQAAMAEQSITVNEGDVVLLHTGWTDAKLDTAPEEWGQTIPGITNAAASYLASLKPMAVGADTWGVGAVPAIKGDKIFYDHVVFLKHNGIFILETMNTGRLARESVREFMFVLGQARLQGAVQMIINPVAMW
jgi:kynurenine formamidase